MKKDEEGRRREKHTWGVEAKQCVHGGQLRDPTRGLGRL